MTDKLVRSAFSDTRFFADNLCAAESSQWMLNGTEDVLPCHTLRGQLQGKYLFGGACWSTSESMALQYLTPLTPEEQTHFGILAPAPLALADRVKFSELDPLNHVNNAAYLYWFENARIRYFHECGVTRYQEDDPRVVLRNIAVEYRAEMRLHDDYIVTARCSEYRRTSFTLEHEVWRGDTCCTTACAVIVLLKADGSGRQPISDSVIDRFRHVDGARQTT